MLWGVFWTTLGDFAFGAINAPERVILCVFVQIVRLMPMRATTIGPDCEASGFSPMPDGWVAWLHDAVVGRAQHALTAPKEAQMTELTLRRNRARDLTPLIELLSDPDDLLLVNPSAGHPFDPREWQEKWLQELDDESFYLLDGQGREVGFFALRVGVGPEVRHLTYVFVAEEWRGGTGHLMVQWVEEAARDLGALTVTLKCELDNPAALRIYEAAGYEELSRRGGMASMRKDLDSAA